MDKEIRALEIIPSEMQRFCGLTNVARKNGLYIVIDTHALAARGCSWTGIYKLGPSIYRYVRVEKVKRG